MEKRVDTGNSHHDEIQIFNQSAPSVLRSRKRTFQQRHYHHLSKKSQRVRDNKLRQLRRWDDDGGYYAGFDHVILYQGRLIWGWKSRLISLWRRVLQFVRRHERPDSLILPQRKPIYLRGKSLSQSRHQFN